MDKVLILGINGFIGTHFQSYIGKNNLSNEFYFIGVDNKGDCAHKISFRKVDLLNDRHLEKLIINESPNYIINLAGTFDWNNFNLLLQINANISRKICEISIKNNMPVEKMLFIGSAAEYGYVGHLPITENDITRPVSYYGLAKLVQTQYANFYFNNFHFNMNVARTFNVIGKNISPSLSIGAFIKQIKNAKDGDNIYVGNINTKRDFLDVEDVVDAYWKILLKGKSGEIYNVCSGQSYYIKDILNFLIEESGKRLKISVEAERMRKYDIINSYGDNSKLMKDTGWKWERNIKHSLKGLFD